jgi:hypothetical protein
MEQSLFQQVQHVILYIISYMTKKIFGKGLSPEIRDDVNYLIITLVSTINI